MSQADLDAVRAALEGLPEASIVTPTLPAAVAAQEAEELAVRSSDDRAALLGVGVPAESIDTLRVRAGGLRQAQSEWTARRFVSSEASRVYGERAPAAYALRDELLHHFFYAYRNLPALLDRTQGIAEGDGGADLIQDLSDLAVLGGENPAPLQAIGMDLGLLERAAGLAKELGPLLAVARGSMTAEKQLRDRAFTYLKLAVDEIRAAGRYVFWRDEKRRAGYASAWLRAREARLKRKAETPETAPV